MSILLNFRFEGAESSTYSSSTDEHLPCNMLAKVEPEILESRFSGVTLYALEFSLKDSSSSDSSISDGGV